jgi:uncharacterized protein (TIGR03437 family)
VRGVESRLKSRSFTALSSKPNRFVPVLIAFTASLNFIASLSAAPADRITTPVDPGRVQALRGNVHVLAEPRYDAGAVDPTTPLNDVVIMMQPSAAQQADLDQLLQDQQNPSSARFRKWLTPEEFAGRFGLTTGDQSKVVAWLTSAGFTVKHMARSRNWISFSGTAGQVSTALHTPIHRFQVNGKTHFANTTSPSIPEALAGVVGGFLGLNDFHLQSQVRLVTGDYDTGGSHFLAPADFTTIYDINPLYQASIDGTGQSIGVIGESDVLLSDITAFRKRYGLPANFPVFIPYGTDPGYNDAEVEGDLDLEWSGAIAPTATIYYFYGEDAFTALTVAVETDITPVISSSYGDCEINYSEPFYRSIAQQANAQGMTILSAAGDSGAAGCQDRGPSATHGESIQFPAALPEVTAVGGTEFSEGSGTYWAATNTSTLGSALSYIPEVVWNESNSSGLAAGGGGASALYSKPAWQTGPGVPSDSARDVPDVSLSSAGHDAYYIYSEGQNMEVYGTSAAAPSMAGMVALLNHYQVTNGYLKSPGLGNINAQLYRMVQSMPTAFHDITSGNNIVPCAQGTPDCSNGSFGYQAGPGYDLASGLGSVDANVLVTNWNAATAAATVTLNANPSQATLNNTVQLTATVSSASGSGAPTGTVNFVWGSVPIGSGTLSNGAVSVTFPAYLFESAGKFAVAAQYSGDATFSPAGATTSIQVTIPATGAAAIVPVAPNTVWAQPADAQGLSWQTAISLYEVAGVPAMITGFTLDGQSQSLSQYFPSPSIPANGSVSATFIFRGLNVPETRVFVFNGVDANGNAWSRQVSVIYQATQTDNYFNLAVTPLTVIQNTSAPSSCQWSVQMNVDDMGGYGPYVISNLYVGGEDRSGQVTSVFGTDQLDAWDGLQGTLCFSEITPPATDTITVYLSSGNASAVNVNFVAAPATATQLSASPANISIAQSASGNPAQATLSVTLSDKTQPWTASVYPANRTTSWLTLSQLSGTGPAQIALTASGAGFEPGAYRATIVIQSPNATPQYINVPVMFVYGGSGTTSISAVVSSASFKTGGAPGMEMSIFGTQLANTSATGTGNPLPNSLSGVSATVNGLAAPLLYVSPGVLNIQVPYTVGAGPAVLGINNNGQVAGYQFQVASSAPGIFADQNGNLVPSASVAQGGIATLYMTGVGEVTPAFLTGYGPLVTTAVSSLPAPVLPLSVTVGNTPAFLEFVGLAPTLVGTTVINFLVPSTVPTGTQELVVTVNGVTSAPVSINVTAPSTSSSQ